MADVTIINASDSNTLENDKIVEKVTDETNDLDTKKNVTKKRYARSTTRFFTFLKLVWALADACGYRVDSRIRVVDIKTGKVWE